MTSGEDGGLEDLVKADLDNSRWLTGVLDDHGWLGRNLVGDDGARAACLLGPACRPRPGLPAAVLGPGSKAVAEGEASPAHLAYLTDRVQLKDLGYQTYGTRYQAAAGTWGLQPVSEPESLEERRLSVGLPH